MSLGGLGVVAIWHDLLPEAKANFYEWHNREHMPERAGIPGFLRGRRYIALQGGPEYFNLYEAQSPEVVGGQDYLNRLNSPTPWTQTSVQAFRNVSRSICRVDYTGGVGQGGVMATLRFDVPEAGRTAVAQQLRQQILPVLCDAPGIVGAHLCLADVAGSQVPTAEKKARADTTLVPTWVVLVEGVNAAALGLVLPGLQAALVQAGAGDVAASVYQLEYTRCKTPWSAG
ncbi:MAG: hypothetical protein ABIP34_16965 [Rhodoferax sp.]|uniref:hypothetical protein n=1 Tax=Rhodoferax sp. TaxID=50421 RepID=UPI0032660063